MPKSNKVYEFNQVLGYPLRPFYGPEPQSSNFMQAIPDFTESEPRTLSSTLEARDGVSRQVQFAEIGVRLDLSSTDMAL